jgi:phosphoribosylaminoimidazole-succinocarboxamide synthase
MINDYHIKALGIATEEELKTLAELSFKVNEILKEYLLADNIILVDFKLEFGKTSTGEIVLADEISPDTCRFWDKDTREKLDKDRFRRSLGGEVEAYQEISKRVLGD